MKNHLLRSLWLCGAMLLWSNRVSVAFSAATTQRTTRKDQRQCCIQLNRKVEDTQRRRLVQRATPAALIKYLLLPTTAAFAETITPDKAYANLVAARDELIEAAQKYLAKADWDGLIEYLQDPDRQINQYETNANVLLTSKRLDIESKKAIGTIRRYGVGADVLIMYGGLRAELESPMGDMPNMSAVQSYMVKTLDSLEEVIVICRSNGFDKQKT